MEILIDFEPIWRFINQPPNVLLWQIFWYVGWIPLMITFLWGALHLWQEHIQGQFFSKQKFIFLAIDIPKGNELSPLAVENLFTYFGGAHGSLNLLDKYWIGTVQLGFSFEIISIEGYIQFVIRTPVQYRNLVESAIYSQYPDAEITEVDDYTLGMPSKFPDDEYDIWGGEFIPSKHWAYPFKTYPEFEAKSGDTRVYFKDPMASLMDMYSSLGPGEQAWYQIIVTPEGFDWPKECDKEISKILGEKVAPEKNLLDRATDGVLELITFFSELIYSLWGDIPDSASSEEQDSFKMFNLKPIEKKRMEAVQRKASKLGYKCKIRYIYIAKKEVMNKPKGVGGFVGYMKQFIDMDLNNLKPDMDTTVTTAAYMFANYRLNQKKTNIINNYRARSGWAGKLPFILNIEELATLWHFPFESVVKAPLIQKTPGRKSEPPMSLPVKETFDSHTKLDSIFIEGGNFKKVNTPKPQKKTESIEETDTSVPANLPFVN